MKTWNVIVNVGLDIELKVQANKEEDAMEVAKQLVDDTPLLAISESDFIGHTEPEVIEAWENNDAA